MPAFPLWLEDRAAAALGAFSVKRIRDDLTHAELVELVKTLTPDLRYRRALVCLADGILWPFLQVHPDPCSLLDLLYRSRHLRVLDELAEKYPMSDEPESEELLALAAEQARFYLLNEETGWARPLLLPWMMELFRRILLQQAPLLDPETSAGIGKGLKGSDLDGVLSAVGFRLGERYRSEALRLLEARGHVRQDSHHGWHALAEGATAEEQVLDAQTYHRRTLLTILDQALTQRVSGMPNAVWVMGYNETQEGRITMCARLAEGARVYLEAHGQKLESQKRERGAESDLVWVSTGLVLCPRVPVRQPIADWLLQELLVTAQAGLLARLGYGAEGARLLKRALADRDERDYRLSWRIRDQQRRRGQELLEPRPTRMAVKRDSRVAWRDFRSFEDESIETLQVNARLEEAALRVRDYLREVLPAARSVYQIYEHAQKHWPGKYHDVNLIQEACERLVCTSEAAENAVPGLEHWSGKKTWLRGFRAITVEFNYPNLTDAYCSDITAHLREILVSTSVNAETAPAQYHSSIYLLRRVDVPGYLEHLRTLREQERIRVEGLYSKDDSMTQESLFALFLKMSPKRVNLY